MSAYFQKVHRPVLTNDVTFVQDYRANLIILMILLLCANLIIRMIRPTIYVEYLSHEASSKPDYREFNVCV